MILDMDKIRKYERHDKNNILNFSVLGTLNSQIFMTAYMNWP